MRNETIFCIMTCQPEGFFAKREREGEREWLASLKWT